MDRLKREWKETQIPEEVRLRARNLAWAKMQRSSGDRRVIRWAAAAATFVIAALLTWIWSSHETRIEQVSPVASQNVLRPAADANQTAKPLIEMTAAQKPKLVEKQTAPVRMSAPAEEPERIVLNFTLPESGARMIWIMDSRFQLEGDNQ